MREWRRLLLVLVAAALPAVAMVTVAADGARAEPTERAEVRMPFAGQWANQFGTAPWEHGRHQDQDWAMDLFAVDAPVRINVEAATGAVDLEVIEVVLDTTCGATAGTYVTVRVSVDGIEVGSVLFHHLVDVEVSEGQHLVNGQVLGRTVDGPARLSGSCWSVSTPMGIHTHLAVANATGRSCYVRHQIGQSLSSSAPIGMLGHGPDGQSVGSGIRADCAGDADVVRCRGEVATIVGTPGHDELIGTNGPDVIAGLGGRDTITGLDGDDIICAGSGADWVDAGAGADYVHGGLTDDVLFGGPGNDLVIGSLQNDMVDGGDGLDRVLGKAGEDHLRGGRGADRLSGGPGDDVLRGGGGTDKLVGRDGHDRCMGGPDRDRTHSSCEVVARRP